MLHTQCPSCGRHDTLWDHFIVVNDRVKWLNTATCLCGHTYKLWEHSPLPQTMDVDSYEHEADPTYGL